MMFLVLHKTFPSSVLYGFVGAILNGPLEFRYLDIYSPTFNQFSHHSSSRVAMGTIVGGGKKTAFSRISPEFLQNLSTASVVSKMAPSKQQRQNSFFVFFRS